MIATAERALASPKADVLGFDIVVQGASSTKRFELALRRLSLHGLALASAAPLAALVTSTIQRRSTYSHALWVLLSALMADCVECTSTATATNCNSQKTWQAIPRVANGLTLMSTRQHFITGLVTIGNSIFARLSWLFCDCRQVRLAARTLCDDVWRSWAVCWLFALWVAWHVTHVLATVELATASRLALEGASPCVAGLVVSPIAALQGSL